MNIQDKGLGLYKRILGKFSGYMIFVLFIVLIPLAFWLGFAYDFSCFGGSSCDNLLPYGFITFPFIFIGAGFWLRRKWRAHQAERYHESVKADVLQELGASPLAPAEQNRRTIIGLLQEYRVLTLDELEEKSGITREVLLSIVRVLMQERVIRQTTDPDKGAYFSLNQSVGSESQLLN